MRSATITVLILFAAGIASAGECPILVEPDEIHAGTPVTANWTSVTVCRSDPVIEISESVITVDFNFGYCPGVLPPGACGPNRAVIGRLPPGTYTLIARGHDTERSLEFEVLPVTVPTLNAIGICAALLLFLCSAGLWLSSHSRARRQFDGLQ